VTTDETAPLLLDEVTAQSDSERRLAMLAILHEVSLERQVILFSHDRDVAAWAEGHRTTRDRLVMLPAARQPQLSAALGAPALVPEDDAHPEPVSVGVGSAY
jgi:ABC-type lipoprotein export system ATPase subunit